MFAHSLFLDSFLTHTVQKSKLVYIKMVCKSFIISMKGLATNCLQELYSIGYELIAFRDTEVLTIKRYNT